MQFKHLAPALILVCASLPAWAALEWNSYADPCALEAITYRDGVIWAGGQGGLVRLDTADPGHPDYIGSAEGLPSMKIKDLVASSADEVWIASAESGLLRYRPGAIKPWLRYTAIPNFLLDDRLLCLESAPDGRLWYGCQSGFGVVNSDGPGDVWSDLHGLGNSNVHALAFLGDSLAVGTGGGIYYLPQGGVLVLDENAPEGEIEELRVLAGRLWCLSDNAIEFRLQGEALWTVLPLPLAGAQVQAIGTLGESLVVSLEDSGAAERVYLYDAQGDAWSDLSDNLPTDGYAAYSSLTYGTLAAIHDQEILLGGAYEGGMGPGIVRLSSDASTHYALDDRPMGSEIKLLHLTPGDRLWAMSTLGGAALENDEWTRYPSDTGFSSMPRFGLAVMEDASGWIWFTRYSSSNGSLGCMRPDGSEQTIHQTGDVRVLCMGEDAQGNRFFGYDGQGLRIFDASDNWHTFTVAGGQILSDAVDEIDFLPDGRIALLFRDIGLVVWDTHGSLFNTNDETWYTPSTSPSGGIYDPYAYIKPETTWFSMCAGHDGDIWVGQSEGLIYITRDGSGYNVQGQLRGASSAAQGLIAPQVMDVAASADGSAWVGTEAGLSRVRYESLEGGSWIWTVENWTTEAGRELAGEDLFGTDVLAPLPNHICRQVEVAADGEIVYVGTNVGLVCIRVTPDQTAPPEAVNDAWVYPNPVRFSLGHTEIRLGGVETAVNVRIYNMEGQQVAEPGLVEPGGVLWDLQTRFGNRAVSGIYYARFEYRGQSALREIVIVR